MNVKMLKKENNKLDKEINATNKEAMTDMVCYLRGANISHYHQEMVRRDLLEMVLSAQERGESIQSVIGEDYKIFCDEVIENIPQKTRKERILDFLEVFFLGITILGGINLVLSKEVIKLLENIINGQILNFQMPITGAALILAGINLAFAIIVCNIMCKTALNPKKEKRLSKLKRFIIGGLAGGGIMVFYLLVTWFGKDPLFTVNILAYFMVILILYLSYRLIKIIK